ncbi:MAG: sulfurtransferase [Pseudoxanthomonas sp.]
MTHPLIAADELHVNLAEPGWVVLDCSYELSDPAAGRAAYLAGHIPGALYADLSHDLAGPQRWVATLAGQRSNGGRHPLPDRQALRATLQGFGISEDSWVVAADRQGGAYAARAWWLLRWLGHERVRVLDGGVPAWQAAGLPLAQGEEPAPLAGSLPDRQSLVRSVDVDVVFADLGVGQWQVVDARAPDRFRGENETLDPVGGHIPGALNRFFRDNLAEDGRFKPAAQLRAEWSALAGEPERVILQCGSGVTACHNALALEAAGLAGAALYPGSWSDWVSDASRPVATGPAA